MKNDILEEESYFGLITLQLKSTFHQFISLPSNKTKLWFLSLLVFVFVLHSCYCFEIINVWSLSPGAISIFASTSMPHSLPEDTSSDFIFCD